MSPRATVILKKTSDGTEKTFMMVDDAEADIGQNKVSTSSPIGAAMIGKAPGMTFTIATPRGEVEYEIVSVS
jgi:transcription elongation factor GreA